MLGVLASAQRVSSARGASVGSSPPVSSRLLVVTGEALEVGHAGGERERKEREQQRDTRGQLQRHHNPGLVLCPVPPYRNVPLACMSLVQPGTLSPVIVMRALLILAALALARAQCTVTVVPADKVLGNPTSARLPADPKKVALCVMLASARARGARCVGSFIDDQSLQYC